MSTDVKTDERIIEFQFYQDLARYGITPRQSFSPIMDGKIHRFATAQDKGSEKSGAYRIYANEWPAWQIQDYRQHKQMIKCKFNASDLTANERAKIFQSVNDPEAQKRRAIEKAEEDKRQKENEARAINNAWREYSASNNYFYSEHKYCISKHLVPNSEILGFLPRIKTCQENGDYGKIGDLMIPLYNSKLISQLFKSERWIFPSEQPEEFQSLQLIKGTLNAEGKYQKGIYKGTKISGACFPLIRLKKIDKNFDKIPETFVICEGVATAASLYYFFNYEIPILAAMNCGNLINVAKALRDNAPNSEIIIYADNDTGKNKSQPERNIGYEEALKVKEAGYADKIKQPEISGTDYNDLLIAKGLI